MWKCCVSLALLSLAAGLACGQDLPLTGIAPATLSPVPTPAGEPSPPPVPAADGSAPLVPAAPPPKEALPGDQTPEDEHLVTAGDCSIASDLWQRTWGLAGLSGYPTGRRMAPNGFVYDPVFSTDLQLNIALSRDRSWYLFTDVMFWAQRAGAGVTNARQGQFDFSKRELDLDGGLAWNYSGPWEARAFVYSRNNLNRGEGPVLPSGYNDGFALENRYYLPGTNFDKGLYRFLSTGYYLTKVMTDADGRPFHPGAFVRASLALDIIQERLYLYSDTTYLCRKALADKLVLEDVGVAWRPFEQISDLEFRVGAEATYDLQASNLRTLLYGHVRIVW
jgi:hypothetical protein